MISTLSYNRNVINDNDANKFGLSLKTHLEKPLLLYI